MNWLGKFGGVACLCFVAVAGLPCDGAEESVGRADRLIGHWPFAEDARDASGNGHHGTLMNEATIAGGALSLDGASGYVGFGNLADFTPAGSLSYALWILPAPETPARINRVLGKIVTPGQREYCALLDDRQRLWVFLSGTGGEKSDEAVLRVTGEPVVSVAGEWIHLAVTWDATLKAEGVRVYINGVEVDTLAASSGAFDRIHAGSADLCLGAFDIETRIVEGRPSQTVRNPFKGQVSDFRLYAGVLSPNAVAELAAATPGSRKEQETASQEPGSGTKVGAAITATTPQAVPDRFAVLLDAAQAADAETDYHRAFAMKQTVLGDLMAATASAAPADMEAALRVAAALAPDLDEAQRAELAARLKARFVPDMATVRKLTPGQTEAWASGLWAVDYEAGRSFVKDVFSDEPVWGSLPPATLAILAMLGGKTYGPEGADSVLDPALLEELEKRWILAPALTPEDLANIARAWGGALQGARARVWAMKLYEARLGTVSLRNAATLATLREVAQLFRAARCWGANNDYAEFRAVLLSLAESGARWNSADADLFALLIQTPSAEAELRAALGRWNDPRCLDVAKVLATASSRSHSIHKWWERMQAERAANDSVYGRLVAAIVDGKRVAGDNALRRVWHIERILKQGGGDETARFACLKEYADAWTHGGRPDVALERLVGGAEHFDGPRGLAFQAMVDELCGQVREQRREGARVLKRVERQRLIAPPGPAAPWPAAGQAGKGGAK